MRKRKNGDGFTFRLNQDNLTVQNRTGSTQPGAEQRPVRGRLMLGMMGGVFRRLNLGQPADK